MICERAAAPIGEAPRQPKVLALLPRYSGRHPAAGGRVLPTITAKPAAPFLAFQKDWPFLVGASRSTLPCACSAGRSGHRVVLGRTARRVQQTRRRRVARRRGAGTVARAAAVDARAGLAALSEAPSRPRKPQERFRYPISTRRCLCVRRTRRHTQAASGGKDVTIY